jgi:xanthosine utilization system XapX-like protein
VSDADVILRAVTIAGGFACIIFALLSRRDYLPFGVALFGMAAVIVGSSYS